MCQPMQVSRDDGDLLRYRSACDPRTERTTGDGGLEENKKSSVCKLAVSYGKNRIFFKTDLLRAMQQLKVMNMHGNTMKC